MKQETPVIVRQYPEKLGGGLVALLPTYPADINGEYCTAFAREHGHGAVDYWYVVNITSRATEEKAAELLDYMERVYEYSGLALKQKASRAMHSKRWEEARKSWEKPYPTGLEQCDNCPNTGGVQCVQVYRSENCTVNYCLCPECAKLPYSELGRVPEEVK